MCSLLEMHAKHGPQNAALGADGVRVWRDKEACLFGFPAAHAMIISSDDLCPDSLRPLRLRGESNNPVHPVNHV